MRETTHSAVERQSLALSGSTDDCVYVHMHQCTATPADWHVRPIGISSNRLIAFAFFFVVAAVVFFFDCNHQNEQQSRLCAMRFTNRAIGLQWSDSCIKDLRVQRFVSSLKHRRSYCLFACILVAVLHCRRYSYVAWPALYLF